MPVPLQHRAGQPLQPSRQEPAPESPIPGTIALPGSAAPRQEERHHQPPQSRGSASRQNSGLRCSALHQGSSLGFVLRGPSTPCPAREHAARCSPSQRLPSAALAVARLCPVQLTTRLPPHRARAGLSPVEAQLFRAAPGGEGVPARCRGEQPGAMSPHAQTCDSNQAGRGGCRTALRWEQQRQASPGPLSSQSQLRATSPALCSASSVRASEESHRNGLQFPAGHFSPRDRRCPWLCRANKPTAAPEAAQIRTAAELPIEPSLPQHRALRHLSPQHNPLPTASLAEGTRSQDRQQPRVPQLPAVPESIRSHAQRSHALLHRGVAASGLNPNPPHGQGYLPPCNLSTLQGFSFTRAGRRPALPSSPHTPGVLRRSAVTSIAPSLW